MHTNDFDFELPGELIAQSPLERRDDSRLLHVNRHDGSLVHRQFRDLPSLLRRGDLLVLNDSRVIPARLIGKKTDTGGRVELLLVRPVAEASTAQVLQARADGSAWSCLGQASKPIRAGAKLSFENGLTAEVEEALGGGEYRVRFTSSFDTLDEAIRHAGRLPLPPYISRAPTADDDARYNTVYAATAGSVAAPTAGLHFTPELLASLVSAGVTLAFVTLDVGPGTFLPVREGSIHTHHMHGERFSISPEVAGQIREAKRAGRRVIAVGTTVTRTLEAQADDAEVVRSGSGETAIFIYPGFTFRVIDALITNFHLPKSTLVMLVSAFFGRERTLAAYKAAVSEKYRFFSYGDSMFIDGAA